MSEPRDISDGRWEFYDAWAAFPFNRVQNDDRQVMGEFMVSLSAPGGGTYGEFAIRFFVFNQGDRWRNQEQHARLEAFGDSWRALASNPVLIAALASLDEKPQGPDEIREALLAIGMEDVTAKLRGSRRSVCPTCGGKGQLDDIGGES